MAKLTDKCPTLEEIEKLQVSNEVDNVLFHIHADLADLDEEIEVHGFTSTARLKLIKIMDKVNMLQND